MSSKLPAIADKLAPARRIVDDINQHLRVVDYCFAPDDFFIEMGVRGHGGDADSEGDLAIDDLVTGLLMTADGLLPDGYILNVRGDKFAIVQGQRSPDPDETAPGAQAGEPLYTTKPFCFRLEAGATPGQTEPFFGYVTMHLSPRNPDEDKERAGTRETVAHLCATSVENVTPLTVEEYLAAGGKLDATN